MIRGLLLLFALFSSSSHAQSVTDEILQCEANKSVDALTHPSRAGLCPATLSDSDAKALCEDPVGFACTKNARGRIYDSNCKVSLNDPKDSALTPESIGIRKQVDQAVGSFLDQHRTECSRTLVKDKCDTTLKSKYFIELAQVQKKVIYSPERVKRFQDAFDQAQKALIELLNESVQIPDAIKVLLVQKIQNTKVADPYAEFVNSCYFYGKNDPDTGLFNEEDTDGIHHSVNICAGRIMNLDRMNENDLLLEIGHELTHSIDPCALDLYGLKHPNALISGDIVFGEMNKCLRGGTGPRGCDASVLNCNAKESSDEYCDDEIKNDSKKTKEACLNFVASVPNCAVHAPEADEAGMDLSAYRKKGHPIEQIQESFSDFLGGQVMARVLAKKEQTEDQKNKAKQDALFSLASDFASLHGVCMNTNTLDVHPPGRIRVKRSILGNAETGKFFCPKTPQIGCQGL